MKLRIRGNSIRVRLDRKDIDDLLAIGRLENKVQFGRGPEQGFSYAVALGSSSPGLPCVIYVCGQMQLTISRDDAEAWRDSDRVGFHHDQDVDGGVVSVMLEKDFACLDRAAGEQPDDAWAFPNPSTVC